MPAGHVAGLQTKGREREAKEASGRSDPRQYCAEGSALKKLAKPSAQRKAVEQVQQPFGISERPACSVPSMDRTSIRSNRLSEEQIIAIHQAITMKEPDSTSDW